MVSDTPSGGHADTSTTFWVLCTYAGEAQRSVQEVRPLFALWLRPDHHDEQTWGAWEKRGSLSQDTWWGFPVLPEWAAELTDTQVEQHQPCLMKWGSLGQWPGFGGLRRQKGAPRV